MLWGIGGLIALAVAWFIGFSWIMAPLALYLGIAGIIKEKSIAAWLSAIGGSIHLVGIIISEGIIMFSMWLSGMLGPIWFILFVFFLHCNKKHGIRLAVPLLVIAVIAACCMSCIGIDVSIGDSILLILVCNMVSFCLGLPAGMLLTSFLENSKQKNPQGDSKIEKASAVLLIILTGVIMLEFVGCCSYKARTSLADTLEQSFEQSYKAKKILREGRSPFSTPAKW